MIDACHTAVTAQLKAPSTAAFDTDASVQSKYGTNHGAPQWNVAGTVDSPNSYGAAIRNIYVCALQMGGHGWVAQVPILSPGNITPGYIDRVSSTSS